MDAIEAVQVVMEGTVRHGVESKEYSRLLLRHVARFLQLFI